MIESSKKKPMKAKQVQFFKMKFFRKWHAEANQERQLSERLRVYKYRKSIALKRQIMVNLYLQAKKGRVFEEKTRKVREGQDRVQARKFFGEWRHLFKESLLEKRLVMFKVFKELKRITRADTR